MAFVYRDILSPAVGQLNSFHALHNKMQAAWPMSNGIHYDRNYYFYRAGQWVESVRLKRFVRAMGLSWEEFTSQEVDDDIYDMWFYLDHRNYEWDGTYADTPRIEYPDYKKGYPTSSALSNKFTNAFMYWTDVLDTPPDPLPEDYEPTYTKTLVPKTMTVTVQYGGFTKRYIDGHSLPWYINSSGTISTGGIDTATIRSTLEASPWYYLANSRHMPYTKDNTYFNWYDGADIDVPGINPTGATNQLLSSAQVSVKVDDYDHTYDEDNGEANDALAIFAMMSDGRLFEKVGEVHSEKISTSSSSNVKYDGEVMTYTYSQDFVFGSSSQFDNVMTEITSWYNSIPDIGLNTNNYSEASTYFSKDTQYKKILDSMMTASNNPNTLFVPTSGWGGGYILDDSKSRYMRRSDFATMFGRCIDTGYSAKDAEAWEKIVAVVIVVVAIVAAIFTGGGSLALLLAAEASTIAMAAGAASLVLAVGMYALAMYGGLSAQNLVKIIGKVAQIVGYIATVLGLYAAIQSAGKILAERTLADKGIANATQDQIKNQMLKQTLLDNIGAFLKQSLESITTKLTEFVSFQYIDANMIMDGVQMAANGMELYLDQEEKELAKELEELQEEENKYAQETLNNQLKNPAAVYLAMEDRITSYDALSELDIKMQSAVGMDENFMTWYSNVNAK